MQSPTNVLLDSSIVRTLDWAFLTRKGRTSKALVSSKCFECTSHRISTHWPLTNNTVLVVVSNPWKIGIKRPRTTQCHMKPGTLYVMNIERVCLCGAWSGKGLGDATGLVCLRGPCQSLGHTVFKAQWSLHSTKQNWGSFLFGLARSVCKCVMRSPLLLSPL